jgi:cytochrome b subunit of formate dehydrogenase
MARTGSGYLRKFNRLLVWPTTVLLIVFVVSGYGITNPALIGELTGGILDRSLSLYLHLNLAVPVLILLLVHILIGLKSTLNRWGVKEGNLLNAFLILLGIFVTVLILLMQYSVP